MMYLGQYSSEKIEKIEKTTHFHSFYPYFSSRSSYEHSFAVSVIILKGKVLVISIAD